MKYTVEIRIFWFFWRRIKAVVADGLVEGTNLRWLALESGERIEFPVNSELRFSKERQEAVRLAEEARRKEEHLSQMKGAGA